ncbi:hypothetical protein AB0O14_07875 [Microbacterium foliorum]
MSQNPGRHAGSTPLVACVATGVGTVVTQSIVLVTIAKGLSVFLLLWSEKPANG